MSISQEFHDMQNILKGIDHIKEIASGYRKILLVCDSSFPYLSIKDEILGALPSYVVFDHFSPNPLYEDVLKGVDIFNSEKCDVIVAVGGGSSIDVAKCIKLYHQMSGDKICFEQPYIDTGVTLIAIPTTAGTGSESTRYAVIYYKGNKQSVTHDSIIPNYAILEPTVLSTLPLYQKKCTMLDALCQGIESWWSVNSTDESKHYSKVAVETIMKWWRRYLFDNDPESFGMIMQAANYAGRAICITQTTAPHAFSYKLTSFYGIPHGHAVAVCLPEIWSYMFRNMDGCIDQRGAAYLQGVFYDIAVSMGCSSVEDAIRCFRTIMDTLQMKNPESDNCDSDLDVLSHSVNPIRLKNNPVLLSEETIYHIYKEIVKFV